MTEIFDGLSVAGDPVSDEDRVIHLLASLPDSFNMLVTALEANPEVPKMEVVTERLLHEERKLKERADAGESSDKALTVEQQPRRKGPQCHHCGKFGHIKCNCYDLAKAKKTGSQKANKVEVKRRDSSSSDSESAGMLVCHTLSVSAKSRSDSWIVDSGATCHMCNNVVLFVELHSLKESLQVTLGDGHTLEATGRGTVALEMKLPDGTTKVCKLNDVLYVPKLSYNLLSVSKATKSGKTAKFSETGCRILDTKRKLIATGTRVGSLYYLNRLTGCQHVIVAESVRQESKEEVWHRRFGHLGVRNLQKLAKDKLVSGYDYDVSKEIGFCESCAEGKHYRSQFPTGGGRSEEPLGLVHSDVCGKMNAKSLSGAEYFPTFIDDCTHYVWRYMS